MNSHILYFWNKSLTSNIYLISFFFLCPVQILLLIKKKIGDDPCVIKYKIAYFTLG